MKIEITKVQEKWLNEYIDRTNNLNAYHQHKLNGKVVENIHDLILFLLNEKIMRTKNDSTEEFIEEIEK